MLIYFIISLYWVQTDWSGNSGENVWNDTSSYFESKTIDSRRFPGELCLFAPSGEWETSAKINPAKEVNAIIEADNGIIYVGCGWDSARVIKFGAFGDSIISRNALGTGRVLSLLMLHNQNILVGTSNGNLFIGKDTSWTLVKNFGAKILSLYQSQKWIFLGTDNGKIWIDETGEGQSWDYSYPLPKAAEIWDIFESSDGILYVCTKGSDGKARLFWSKWAGWQWDSIYTFPNSEVVYSICEDPEHNLYVSTGFQGKLFTSSDSGQAWQEINSPSSIARFYNIISDSMGMLYVGGVCIAGAPKGMIFMSEDKGTTWDTLFYSEGINPSKIIALTQSRDGFMFAGGDTDVVFRSGYNSSGWLESSWYDVFKEESIVNNSLEFGRIHYNSSGEIAKLKVRSTDNLDSIPNWGEYVPNDSNPVDYGSAKNGDRYIQYRVELSSDSTLETPLLSEMCLAYKIDVDGPKINSAIACDGEWVDSLVDKDDYVKLYFDEPTNEPVIETSNIDEILKLSSGHSWKSDSGCGIIKYPGEWVNPSVLKIYLSTLKIGAGEGYPPTIEVGDTIYPDSLAIYDKWDNICWSPCVIKGSFAGVEEGNERLEIRDWRLQIYPNPFQQVVSIKYQVLSKSNVSLTIHDIAGRLVRTLVDEEKKPGDYSMKVQSLTSGVYFLKFKVKGEIVSTKKIISFK
ncbi:T9SS type A sorting domain-containing protein [candidate division WOR-3 bacterium]|nr:T9SS type A sorting domain-containing protein [candidate division WOR-3 bacterium]